MLIQKTEREREMFYLTMHSTHFIYGYMASDIWLRTILIVRKETRCRQIGYSLRLTARVLLYAPSHRQDSTYHILCYISRGALGGTKEDFFYLTTHSTHCIYGYMASERVERDIAQWVHHIKDRSDDPSHHERTPLPWSYISLPPLV